MFGITSLLIVALPIFFQLIFGTMSAKGTLKIKFGIYSLLSIITQILFSIISYSIAVYNFENYFKSHPDQLKCGTGFVALIFFIFAAFLFLLFIIIVQYVIKRMRLKTSNQDD